MADTRVLAKSELQPGRPQRAQAVPDTARIARRGRRDDELAGRRFPLQVTALRARDRPPGFPGRLAGIPERLGYFHGTHGYLASLRSCLLTFKGSPSGPLR